MKPTIAPQAAGQRALFEILIVEDHPMMIRSIQASLEAMHPAGAAAGSSVVVVGTLMQARQRLQRPEPPDLVIADLNLPDSRGLPTLRALREAAPRAPIVVFSANDDASIEQAALCMGARAFIAKSALPRHFVQTILSFLPSLDSPAKVGTSAPVALHPIDLLTERQRAVLAEVAQGYRNREVALRLKIGEQTVRTHLNTVFQRLGVQNRTQASMQYVAWANSHGTLV